jgi:hypothetical protein
MKKFLLAAICFGCVGFVSAQKNINGLIQAEKNFAAYSVNHSTKEGFLQFMDSAAIMFDKGKPVNGFQLWATRKQNTAVLNWRPQLAAIATSGDLGFTTGPWTFQRSAQDTVIARGQYSTIWHLDKNGEWKFLVDLGVSDTPPLTDTNVIQASVPVSTIRGTIASLEKAENNFIATNGVKMKYKKYLSLNACLLRNGISPATLPDDYAAALINTPDSIQYSLNGSGIASSGDFGYVYGTTVVNGKTDNYLRVWRNEKAGWKIVLEVLHY